MDCGASMHNHLEQMLHDKSIEPKDLPLSLLNDITNNFSEDQQVGRGGFAVVYKGALGNGGTVAVKKLDQKVCIDENKFIKEVSCLMNVKHKNIVRFLGYCSDTQGKMSDYGGKFVMADVRQRLLCFEYHPNGSLDKYITEVSGGLEWRMRYQIIRGICAALHYLHEKRIVHLDLKPANILLDNGMVPKISDFGLSRCFEENQSRTITSKVVGSIGYLAPEFYNGVVTFKSDIYSLGVIIMEILTGHKGYSSVKNVRESWRNRSKQSLEDTLLEQISVCTEIGIQCIDANPDIRPDTLRIIEMLDEVESTHDSTETGTSTSSFMQRQDGESIVLPKRILGRTSQVRSHADAVFLAASKIGSISAEATQAVVTKLLEKDVILKELPRRIEEIGKELMMMDLVIKHIGTPSLNNELVTCWIAEVRDLAHHVEDVFDKYSYNAFKLEEENRVKNILTNRVKKILIKSHYVTVFSKIAKEITEIEKSIENIVKRKERWLPQSQLSPNLPAYIERMWSQDFLRDVVQDDLVGIEENRRLLTGWLNSDDQITKIITVSGMGGLGKTTLVTNVYEQEKFNFPTYAWIVVSRTYDVVELQRKLLRKVGEPEQSRIVDLDANDMKVKIKERLAGKKCLIVLDDVWNQEAYTQIRDAFHNLQATWVIITTRQEQVAALAHPTRQLKLKPLEHRDAFVLFCRKAFYSSTDFKCPDELEKLANNIVDRCQGLPLAIVTMGGLLSTRPPVKQVWNETYKKFQDELRNDDHVRAILNLSYHDLPGNIRNCFFYCSLFPEDHLMSRESLVWLWVAEGFVLQNEQSTPEEMADKYLRELIQRNMLEAVEDDELGKVRTCKMHDLVRDLALSVDKEEKFGFAYDFGTLMKMDKGVRRLSSCGWQDKTSLSVKIQLPRLRTLVALGIIESSPQLLSLVLSESMYLTVLELQDSEISEVPASIGNMFNLRYIGLRRTRVKSLPESIGKLSNLQTLDIKQTKIGKLPRGVVKIKKLRHLLADTYADEKQSEFRFFIGVQAPKELSNFEELQTLETVEANKDLAEQLIKLTKLRNVWIDNISAVDCANLFSALSKMPLLSSLLLSASDDNEPHHLEALKPASENFHRLIIRGCWADNTLQCPVFHDSGRNLKYLAISWCHLQEDPLQLLAPYVPNLTYLSLNRVSSPNTLVLSKGCFPELKTLVLKSMPNVDKVEIRVGALRQIEGLYVVSLQKLDNVPEGIESLRSLKKLWLLGLHRDFRGQWDSRNMDQKMQYVPELRI